MTDFREFDRIMDEIGEDDARRKPKIARVMFNSPATIVWLSNGVKSVAVCGECPLYDARRCAEFRYEDGTCAHGKFDPFKGMTTALSKTVVPYSEIERWLP